MRFKYFFLLITWRVIQIQHGNVHPIHLSTQVYVIVQIINHSRLKVSNKPAASQFKQHLSIVHFRLKWCTL